MGERGKPANCKFLKNIFDAVISFWSVIACLATEPTHKYCSILLMWELRNIFEITVVTIAVDDGIQVGTPKLPLIVFGASMDIFSGC